MTLDFKKLVLNGVKKEMSIQHFECNAQIFKKEELPPNVLEKIRQVYGQDFAEDANYTLWFSGNNITKETIEKTIFKICNNALGRAANNMNESDLKTLDLGGGTAQPPPETPANQVDSLGDAGAEEANGEALADLMDDGQEGDGQANADDQARIDAEVQDELEGGDEEEDQVAADVGDELEGGSDEEDGGSDDELDSELDSEIDAELNDDSDEEDEDSDDGEDEEETDDEDSDEDEEEVDESVEAPSAGEKFVFIKITMK